MRRGLLPGPVVEGGVPEPGKGLAGLVEPVQPVGGAYPQATWPFRQDCFGHIITEAFGVIRLVKETPEGLRAGVKAVEAAIGGNPKNARFVLQHCINFVITDAGGVPRPVFINRERIAIVAVQAVIGAKPEVALPALKAGINGVIRQALLMGEFFYGIS